MRKDFISLFNQIARTRFTNHDKEETDMWKAFEDMQKEAMEKGIEQGIERGIEQGIEQGKELATLESIKNIMISCKGSIQQAMDVLDIPEEDRAKYMRKL